MLFFVILSYNGAMVSSSVNKRFFIPVIVLVSILSLNLFPVQARGVLHLISVPFHSLFWRGGTGLSGFFSSLQNAGSLAQERDLLLSETLMLKGELATLQSAETENEELRKALNLSLRGEFRLLSAEIFAKDLRADIVLIKLPQENNVTVGMPVITRDKVLAGRVLKVSGSIAKVMLISHPDSSFDARVPGKDAVGIVKGEGKYQLLFDLVPKEATFSLGDMVATSSLGGVFPQNLLVGEVREIRSSDSEPFQRSTLNPFFNLQKENILFVILEF